MSLASPFRFLARALTFALAVVATAFAQTPSALDGFEPDFDGSVLAVATLPDGRVLVGGQFTAYRGRPTGPIARNNLARLNADGSLDEAFNPNVNGVVRAIVVQSDGKVVIGGDFTGVQPSVTTVTRNRIARLNTDGTVDTAFNPNLGGALQPQVLALMIQTDGKIVAGGTFTTVQANGATAAVTRNRLARFNADGSLDAAFDPNPNGVVLALALHVDNKIVVAGGFTTFQENGKSATTTRNRIARLNANGTLDSEFNPNANNAVAALAIQRDGKIVLAGSFTTLQPPTDALPANRERIGRLNVDGTLDSEFYPNANAPISAVLLQADGGLVVGGSFNSVWGRGSASATRNYVARFLPDGSFDASFNPGLNAQVNALAAQADGKVIVGGSFTRAQPAGVPAALVRNRLARLNADGSVDATLQLSSGGRVLAAATQADGKVVIVGSFTSVGGSTHNYVARLNADGSVDNAYKPDFNGRVYTAVIQSDGKVIVGGAFTTIGGEPRNHIARLNPIGTIDSEFNPNIDGDVATIVLQSDGKILVGGSFNNVQPLGTAEAKARTNILRLNADGTLDSAFDPGANAAVSAIAVQSDGKILLGGVFSTITPNAGTKIFARSNVARVNADGSIDDTFNPAVNSRVSTIAVQSDGKVVIGGFFTSILGTKATASDTRNFLARLNTDGTVDSTFNPNANGPVIASALQADGKLIIGGAFTTLQPNSDKDWTLRKYAARLNTDGSVDSTFNLDIGEQFGNRVDSVRLASATQLLIGGTFTSLQPTGSSARVAREGFARVNLGATIAVDTAFNPGTGGAAGGLVNALAIQGDNKIIAVGNFSDLGGAKTSNVARFTPEGLPDPTLSALLSSDGAVNAVVIRPTDPVTPTQLGGFAWLNRDGSLRAAFTPSDNARLSGRVYATLVQADGKLVVAGAFSNLSNATGGNLVRFTTTGALDTAFNPSPNGVVTGVIQQPDGKLLVVGAFSMVAGVTRNNIARLNADGSLDKAYDPNCNGRINAATLQSDSKLLIGGAFTTFTPNGTTTTVTRNYMARVNTDGTVDDYNPSPNLSVSSITIQGDGKAIAGGLFSTVQPNGTTTTTTRNYIARFNTDGSLDQNFDPNANAPVLSVVAQANGQILVGGQFTQLQPGQTGTSITRNNIARVNSDGAVDLVFNPNANSFVTTIALQADGGVMIAGAFTTLQTNGSASAVSRKGLARLGADGSLDLTFNPDLNGDVSGIAARSDGTLLIGGAFTGLQPTGAIILGGSFTNLGGVAVRNLASVNSEGSLNASFQPNPNGAVNALVAQPDGRVVVAGAFTTIAGSARNRLARFGSDGSLDSTFNPNVSGPVQTLALQADGRLLAGGTFTAAGGQSRTNLARFNADGSLDSSFTATVSPVAALAVQADGKVLVVSQTAAAASLIVRLNADGSADSSFPSVATTGGLAAALALQADGRVLVSGSFTSIGGAARARLARLNANGSVDSAFDPGVNGAVTALALQSDGRVAIAGNFTLVGGVQRVGVARLAASAAPTQTLAISADRRGVTWVRGGTAAELSAVVFEYSGDRSKWTRINNPARVSGTANWQATGLILPPTGLFYIRVRGIAPTSNGGSSGVVEMMREFNFASPVPGLAATIVTASAGTPSTAASTSQQVQSFTYDTFNGVESLRVIESANGTTSNTVEIVVNGVATAASNRASTSRLVNLSTRGRIAAGSPLLVGFAVSGTESRQLLVRGVGPTLGLFGVTDAVAATEIQVIDSAGRTVASNLGWASAATVASAAARTGAFPLPERSADSAALVTLAPGTYTLLVSVASASASGVALAEVYDADTTGANSRLINISTRGAAAAGSGALISGFVIAGDSAQRVLLRGAGPALAKFGLSGVNTDPVLGLYDTAGRLLGGNDNWVSDSASLTQATASVGAFAFEAASRDAAVLATLPAGAYTVQLTGAGAASGVALIEIYELP